MGAHSGDYKCVDCGKTEYGDDWVDEDRKKLIEKRAKEK